MSDELQVLCRERPTLCSGVPAGLAWDPDVCRGTFQGAAIVLTDAAVVLPDGDRFVAVVTISWSHRGIREGSTLAIEALAERIARAARGEIFDPRETLQSESVTAYRRERDAMYERARQSSEEAHARIADLPLPRTHSELRAAFAAVILSSDAAEPRTIDPETRALFDRVTRSDHEGHAGAAEQHHVFEEFVLSLAREGVRIAKGDYDLPRMFAAYGLDAARRTPAVRAELERGGPLAIAICACWTAHDAHRAKERAWLRRAWPRIEEAELKFSPANDPGLKSLRRTPKRWPDELVDALIDACDRSTREWRTPHVAPFVKLLGLSRYDAEKVIKHIGLNRPTR